MNLYSRSIDTASTSTATSSSISTDHEETVVDAGAASLSSSSAHAEDVVPNPGRKRTRRADDDYNNQEEDDQDDQDDQADDSHSSALASAIRSGQFPSTRDGSKQKADKSAKKKAATSKNGKKGTNNKRSKPNKPSASDSDFESDSGSDPATAASAQKGGNNPDSLIRFCRRCLRKYIPEYDHEELCLACANMASIDKKGGGRGGAGKLAAIKRRRARLVDEVLDGSLMSLRDQCIKLVAENIEHVEEFGDIPDSVKRGISRILSRRRQINSTTMKLFIGPAEHSVELFDCARLDAISLSQIGQFSPNLRILNLGDCGQMTDYAINVISESCSHITRLFLRGAFLVSDSAFAEFFAKRVRPMEEVVLENAAKLGELGLSALVEMSLLKSSGGLDLSSSASSFATAAVDRGLRRLGLSHCEKVTDNAIKKLHGLQAGSLESFELGYLGSVTDEAIVELLQVVGGGLNTLQLVGFPDMSDSVLTQGIAPYCVRLETLSLAHGESLTDDGIVTFLNTWGIPIERNSIEAAPATTGQNEKEKIPTKPPPPMNLRELDFTRCLNLTDDSITSLANLHGARLEKLSLNGLDELTETSVRTLISACSEHLRDIDVSFVRAFDDELFGELIRKCGRLSRVKVYGASKLTENSLTRRWSNAAGEPINVVGSEFD